MTCRFALCVLPPGLPVSASRWWRSAAPSLHITLSLLAPSVLVQCDTVHPLSISEHKLLVFCSSLSPAIVYFLLPAGDVDSHTCLAAVRPRIWPEVCASLRSSALGDSKQYRCEHVVYTLYPYSRRLRSRARDLGTLDATSRLVRYSISMLQT